MSKTVKPNPVYVFDSFAFLCLFKQEAGYQMVQELLNAGVRGECHIHLSVINYGEIIYSLIRKLGGDRTESYRLQLEQLPINFHSVDKAQVLEAAEIKAQGGLSFADAFAVALSRSLQATLVTGDPEFKKFEPDITIQWLS